MPSSAPPTDAHHRLLAPAPGSVLAEFTSGRRLSCLGFGSRNRGDTNVGCGYDRFATGLSNAGLENFSKHERDY